ncbi:hypothetical protein ACH5RR_039152 [Cinchona calisaya]|uniref:CBF1-interacting co-repressor CIR N-terminal domain-containing protein n=1 Tax=Cinchona calisaya TaxID=153742 RepID=A0ABD2Y2X2_9GENT
MPPWQLEYSPKKRWNVYNYENQEKFRRDEQAAAKEEQHEHDQSRKLIADFYLEQLEIGFRKSGSDAKHMNLFEGIRTLIRLVRVEKLVEMRRRKIIKDERRRL